MSKDDFDDLYGEENNVPRSNGIGFGYESDSEANIEDSDASNSDDNDDDEEEKDRGEEASLDDEDDMFASDSEKKPVKKKKVLKGFNLKEFEDETEIGQEIPEEERKEANFGGLEEAEVEEDEGEEECQMEAFSIRKEVERGVFDKNNTVIPKEDSEEENEPWMENLNKAEIKKAREAQMRQNISKKQTEDYASREASIECLIGLLQPAETAYDALQRLRPVKQKSKKSGLAKISDDDRKTQVFQLTEACENCVNIYGISQIYDLSREQLMRAYKQITGKDIGSRGTKRTAAEAGVDLNEETDAEASKDDQKIWEFRWTGEPDINGPYSSYEMRYWKENYFENGVEVRTLGKDDFVHVSKISFDM